MVRRKEKVTGCWRRQEIERESLYCRGKGKGCCRRKEEKWKVKIVEEM
jgi:hypothetical protein